MGQERWTALLLLITVVWGATFVVVKQATEQLDVLWFLFLRFSLAALLMFPIAIRRTGRQLNSAVDDDAMDSLLRRDTTWANIRRWPQWRVGIGIGAVLAVSYLLQTFGLQRVEASVSGLITGLFVVLGPVLNRLIFRVGIRPLHWMAVVASMGGLCLLTGAAPQQFEAGEWLTLGCATTLGLHVCLLDRFAHRGDPFVLATVQIVTAAGIFAAALLITEPLGWTQFAVPTISTWGAIFLTAILATAVGYAVQTTVQQHLSAVRVAVILAMEPVFAAVAGCLAGERFGPWQVVGGAIMLASMLTAEFGPRLLLRADRAVA